MSVLERCPSQGELRCKEISETFESQGLTATDRSKQVSVLQRCPSWESLAHDGKNSNLVSVQEEVGDCENLSSFSSRFING